MEKTSAEPLQPLTDGRGRGESRRPRGRRRRCVCPTRRRQVRPTQISRRVRSKRQRSNAPKLVSCQSTWGAMPMHARSSTWTHMNVASRAKFPDTLNSPRASTLPDAVHKQRSITFHAACGGVAHGPDATRHATADRREPRRAERVAGEIHVGIASLHHNGNRCRRWWWRICPTKRTVRPPRTSRRGRSGRYTSIPHGRYVAP